MNYVAPDITLDAFNCPFCGAYAHMRWDWLINQSCWLIKQNEKIFSYSEAICTRCEKASLWLDKGKNDIDTFVRKSAVGEMIYPDFGMAPLPENDMPEDVVRDYQEAAKIFSKSPRGAAALLRLGLQKLCKHLGEKGENINDDIRSLAIKERLSQQIIQVADTVRITGNCAVHPGEMSDEDVDHVASKMFELLNFIVEKAISEPKRLKALYQKTPEGPRKSAESHDAKSKTPIKKKDN